MKTFLIVIAIIALIIVLTLSISAEFTIIFDNGWTTKIRVLFIERDIELTKLLSFLVAPDKAGKEAAERSKDRKKSKTVNKTEAPPESTMTEETSAEAQPTVNESQPVTQVEVFPSAVREEKPLTVSEVTVQEKEQHKKRNPIQKIFDEDGVVGILLLVSNLLQTVNSAVTTLIKGLHIYSLYVKMIIGGGDAATIGEKFGSVCGWYYPMKGVILNQMKVDNYDDLIMPDFIAPRSEYELQFIGSISIGLLTKVGLKAGKVFLVNFIKNK